jgi:hypothetical protein
VGVKRSGDRAGWTPLRDAASLVEHYRRFWAESFDRLDVYLNKLKSKEKTNGGKRRKSD